jgi:pimeloyl-ACP methyl ester carboxylesterase
MMVLLAIDAALHRVQPWTADFKWRYGDKKPPTHLTVVLTGAQSTGSLLAHELGKCLHWYGDFVALDYNRHRFDGEGVARDLAHKIRAYDEVTFIGLSMGGLLAHDTIAVSKALDANNFTRKKTYRLILVDAPTGLIDLKDQAAKFIAPIPIGPMASAVFTKPFWYFGFKPPKLDEIEAGDNPKVLMKHWELSGSYPIDGWRDEISYIVGHEQPRRDVLAGVPTVILQSSKDVTVLPSFYHNWAEKFDRAPYYMEVESTHIGLLEFPGKWSSAFAWAYERLRDMEPSPK